MLFSDYFINWVNQYKRDTVRKITLNRYLLTYRQIKELAPNLQLSELNHTSYQTLINDYAKHHARLTVKNFHHQLKASILDALNDHLISQDPTRHTVIQGQSTRKRTNIKYLNLLDLKRLLNQLTLNEEISIDWLILLIAKTGLRVGEALGLTKADFDFQNNTLSINKTWDYKSEIGGFALTKNHYSIRTIQIDPITSDQFKLLISNMAIDQPIFIANGKRVFVATINYRLKKYCRQAQINPISIHGLRHTHASLLLYDGVSMTSVAKRLGHSNITTTQNTYMHAIRELEMKDSHKILDNMIRLA